MKKKVKVTFETERLLVISRGNKPSVPCPECGGRSQLVTLELAAELTRISPRAVYRMVEARKLHFIETAEGALLICLNSLDDLVSDQHG